MSKIVHKNLPCYDQVECQSSDARQEYEGGTSFCFSCGTFFPAGGPTKKKNKEVSEKIPLEDILVLDVRGFEERKIKKKVTEHYGVRVSYNEEGNIDAHYYPYGPKEVIGYKIRELPKKFSSTGKIKGLFGQHSFSPGGKRLVITEGELDAMSVAQAYLDKYQCIYPVVSLPSASGVKELLENRDWVRSFEEVVLMLDNDPAGEKALEECIKIVGVDKVKVAKLPRKDASDVLVELGSDEINKAIWNAQRHVPSGIIGRDELWKALEEYNSVKSVPYPTCLAGPNSKVKGMRLGEIALFISGTGSGKSTVIREIELHLVQTTEDKIGIISLEESPAETTRKLAGMAINRNPAHAEISIDELRPGFDAVFGDDRVIVLDHQGSMDDTDIVDKLEYMCLMGCKYLFIDHITILVSEGAGDLTGNEAIDKMMNSLLTLAKKHNVYICLVSHLRKAQMGKPFEEGHLPSIDDIKGSGSIKQISFDIIAFSRNMIAQDAALRNTITMRVLKCRYTGLTGDVPGAVYNNETGRLTSMLSVDTGEITL